jgi:hypothetical protein
MATIKQKRVAKYLLDGEKSVSAAMRKAGYAESYSHNPHLLVAQQGFKEAMAACGLTEHLIATSLVDDIRMNVGDRVEELKLGAKILRMTGEDGNTNTAIQININDDRQQFA